MSFRRWGEGSLCHCKGDVFPPEAISRWMDCFVAKCTPRNDIKRATGRLTSPCFVFRGDSAFRNRICHRLSLKRELDGFQLFQLGLGHNTVHPSALVVILFQHVVQFADLSLASAIL